MKPRQQELPIMEPERLAFSLFDKAEMLLEKKASDYTNGVDYHSNFKYSEAVAEPFPMPYKSYAVLIGTKLARLSQLLTKIENAKVNRAGIPEPENESVDDSFVDLINYCALMGERYVTESGE